MNTKYGTAIQPVKKTNLRELLTSTIIEMIESGDFPAGSRMPDELTLREQFHVCRNILREALKELESHGILYVIPGRGTYISPLAHANIQSLHFHKTLRDDTSVLQFFQSRLVLEPQIAYYAALRRTADDIERLRSSLSASAAQGDYPFHMALAAIVNNPLMTDYLRTIFSYLQEHDLQIHDPTLHGLQREYRQRSHRQLLDHVIAGNANSARETMVHYIEQQISLLSYLDLDQNQG